MAMDSKNETIICEILPELCRIYEQKLFCDSLNIFLRNLRFGLEGNIRSEKNCNEVKIEINKVQCVACFENCLAVKQKRMTDTDEMMFGIFREECSQSKTSAMPPEVEALNARLILPKVSDQYVSHIELRNYGIPLNPSFQKIFSCSESQIKLNKKTKHAIYLHIDLRKDKQTSRSVLLEAIFLLLEEMNVKKEIRHINAVCLPFVHFGKIRISLKIDENQNNARIEIFNLFGSLFGFLNISEDMHYLEETEEDAAFFTETMLKNKYPPTKSDSEEDVEMSEEEKDEINSRKLRKDSEYQTEESSTFSYLISILQNDMNLLNSLQDDLATTPLQYLGIDSLRIAELEFHIANSPRFRKCCLKAPYLIKFSTLIQISEFLNQNLLEHKEHAEIKTIRSEKKTLQSTKKCQSKFKVPLSSQQKRILFVNELEKEQLKSCKIEADSQFDEFVLLRFSEFDHCRVIVTLNYLILIHSILRTQYMEDYQYLLSGTECFVTVRKEEKRLTQNSLVSSIRCILKSSTTIQVVFHHISIDGRSLSIFYRQFKDLLNLPKFSAIRQELQYHDYCSSKCENSLNSMEYWKQYFDLEDVELESIPYDFSSEPEILTASYILKSFPGSLKRKFDFICHQYSFSRFELFIGVLEVSLRKVMGISETFAMGFAVDQRTFPFFETIGCFTNVLLYLSTNCSKSDLAARLKKCRKLLKESRSYGDIPFEIISKISGISADLFQIFVVSDAVEVDPSFESKQNNRRRVRFADETIHLEIVPNLEKKKKIAKYPMTFYLREYGNSQLSVEVEYAQEFFRKETIEAVLTGVFKIVNSFNSMKTKQANLNFMTLRKTTTDMFMSDFPKSTISQIMSSNLIGSTIRYFNKNIQLRSDSFACDILKNHVLLYCQLLSEHPVILNMPRNPELVQTVLGAWRAGFYVVPLHRDVQDEQIQKTCNGLGLDQGKVLTLKQLNDFKTRNSRGRVFNRSMLFDLAYVTSTSGSTGFPKLVGTSYEGHSNLARQYTMSFQISSKDTIGQVVDPSFDIFFADVVKSLTNGSRLLLSRDSIATSAELLECSNVYLMPAFLSRLPDMKCLSNLETLQYGGEPLAPQVLQKIHRNNRQLRIYQEFGLTEQTVYSTRRRILPIHSKIQDSEEMRVIGKPYDNIQLEIRSFSDSTEICSRGQLVLKGVGLMRGYFGVTKRVIEEFPTGDEVLKRQNKNILFIGRKDMQVKIRGHRVDLFEIECIALSSGFIEECTCITVQNKNLVLFFKLKTEENLKDFNIKLQCWLEKKLISYKMPNHLIKLSCFPLTRTGKIDKKKLAEVFETRDLEMEKIEKQETNDDKVNSHENKDVEELLLKWLQVYSNSRIESIDDDIFSSGADSIAIMFTMQKLRSEKIEIPVKTFFELKTVRGIAAAVLTYPEAFEEIQRPTNEYSRETTRTTEEHFNNLNHIQQRILFLSRIVDADLFSLQFSIPIFSQSLEKLCYSVNLVAIGNQMVRSTLQRIHGEYRFVLLSGTECYRNLKANRNEHSKFDPYTTKIWWNEDKEKLSISIHHMICDGRSLEILKNQIKAILEKGPEYAKFQNAFHDRTIQNLEYPEIFSRGLDTWKSLFPKFKLGSKTSKVKFSLPGSPNKTPHSIPLNYKIGFAYCKAVFRVFQIECSFPIATTFANRTTENWDTVSMFANTLPLIFDSNQSLEHFSEKFYQLAENSNIPLTEILKNATPGNGNYADFALNFHKSLNETEENYEEVNQFPMVMTFSRNDEMIQIEFDKTIIEIETVENLRIEILSQLGFESQESDEVINVDFVEMFKLFLKFPKISEDTDFFLAGGHSLTAMKLIDYLSDLLSVEIPLKLIFEFRTPTKLKNAVSQLIRGKVPQYEDFENTKVTGSNENKTFDVACSNNSPPKNLYSNQRDFNFSLSRQQNQMFYLSQYTKNSLEYQLPFIQPFASTITPSEIHRSLLMTIQEQVIFRTIFRINLETGEPYQEVVSMTEAFIRCNAETVISQKKLHERIQILCEEPIEVLNGQPLLRATFVTSPDKHVAFLHLHHLISDARSTQLTNSTMQSYFGNVNKNPKRQNFTYMDYCRLEKSELCLFEHIDLEYSKALISGFGSFDFLKNKKNNTVKVSVDIQKELIFYKLTSGKSGNTPFSVLLNMISSNLLDLLPQNTTFNIAFPVLNRNERTSSICGYFLNNLVINSAKLDTLPFVLSANVPYSNLIREIRHSSGEDKPLAEVYINCRYDLEFDESDDDVLLDLVPLKLHFPIEFDVDLLANEIYRVTMRSDRFTTEEMFDLLMKMKNKLSRTQMSMMKFQKCDNVLCGERKDVPNFSIPELYHKLFTSNASSAFAISSCNRTFSYGHVYQRILGYSWKLSRDFLTTRAAPVRSDDIIAVIGLKSVETTIRCLAVQLTGAAYLPIDDDYPDERKKNILKDSLYAFHEYELNESITFHNYLRHVPVSTPHCLSYIITTSGTTGHPKSVAIGADSFSNLCLSSTLTMRVSSSSRIFQFTNFVFDNSVLEVSMAISSQATLIYGTPDFDPSEFEKLISDQGITHCLLFPSLVQSFEILKIRMLPYWIVGGERLPQNLLNSALDLGIRVIQNYGPTETTAFAIAKPMKKIDNGCQIGIPTINSKLKLLKDESQNPMNYGELLISGTGIMRGYLNRKSCCFKNIDGYKWYPSGDICRFRSISEVDFVGRTDSQIKIRGYRVELSEIEKIIEVHESIDTCKAFFESESHQIHVFYTGKLPRLSPKDIREHCQNLLEPHKIPSTFNSIDEFPLTRNSKIDKAKLMDIIKNPNIEPMASMECTIESQLTDIWSSLLNCSKPSISDHFFLIGGHSLLLIRLRHLIQVKLKTELTIPEVLENLKFGDMIQILKEKNGFSKRTDDNRRILVFFPALYGGCTAYLKLISVLKSSNENIEDIILLDEESGESVNEVAYRYQIQIKSKVSNSATLLILIGASSAGTFAFATSQKFEKSECTDVVLLDSGTFWNLIENLEYSKHENEMIENLKTYYVDLQTSQRFAESSWKTLQLLKHYKPEETTHGSPRIHVLSVDGTDLGWTKYSRNLKVYKINGDHYSMLQKSEHVLEIVNIIEGIVMSHN